MQLKKLTYLSLILLNFTCILISNAQNITFIEEEFKSEVIAQGIDTNEDGEISVTEANLVNSLELRNLDISSLEDLNHFQNLEEFTSSSLLEIEAIELKNFQNLRSFSFQNTFGVDKAISFTIKNLPELESFSLKSLIKQLEFDTLPKLHYFEVINKAVANPFHVDNFNLSYLPNVENFILDKCIVSHLSFSDNMELRNLTVSHSTLSTIDLTENTNLRYLDLSSCNLSDINLSNNLLLETLDVNFNWFGNNLRISDLPKLKYINASNTGLTNLDFTNLDSLEILIINSNGISDFDQTYVNLKQLHVIGNAIEEFDATQFPSLQELYCADIKIKNLNLSDFSELKIVGCGGEDLEEITFDENLNLESISVNDSNLSELSISNKPMLNSVSLFRNYNLEEVVLQNLPLLIDVSIYINNVNYFDAEEINNLNSLRLEGNNLSTIDLSGINSIDKLNLGSNAFTSFTLDDVKINSELNLDNNPLESLDFYSIKDVPILSLHNVLLPSIDLSQTKVELLRIDNIPNLDTLILKNNIHTNLGLIPGILDTPNLRYICIDSSEQDLIQYTIDMAGISATIESECESFTTDVLESSIPPLKIYPNPTQSEVYIQLAGKNQVFAYDSFGQLVLNELMENELKISNLDSGYYFIQIYSYEVGKSYSSKIIVKN